jgi:hypothetical protein
MFSVHVAQAVQVVVVSELPPPGIRLRDPAHQGIVRSQVVGVRGRPSRGVQRLAVAVRQLDLPLLAVQRMLRHRGEEAQDVPGLHRLAGSVGVQEHDVVRVDQVHRKEPRLSLSGELGAAAPQPAHSHLGDDPVGEVAAKGVGDDVPHSEVVAEPVRLHLPGEELLRSPELVDGLELLGQVPLALVGGVVAGLAQQVPQSPDLRGHARDPRKVGVVEHPGLLDVPPGVEHRPRRSADAGVDPVVLEDRAAIREPLVRRQAVVARKLTGPEVPLLISQDKQDVVGTAARLTLGPGRRAGLGHGGHGRLSRPRRRSPRST